MGKPDTIDAILKVLKDHYTDKSVLIMGCIALYNMSEANSAVQRLICEKGGVKTLCDIIKRNKENEEVLGECLSTLGVLISSKELHERYFGELSVDLKEYSNKEIRLPFFGISREMHSMIQDAIRENVCTNTKIKKCEACKFDENIYCAKCCVQQEAFRCHTCDKTEIKLYCKVCREQNHQGHDCEDFFYPVRCATKLN